MNIFADAMISQLDKEQIMIQIMSLHYNNMIILRDQQDVPSKRGSFCTYRIIPNKRPPPNKRPLFFLSITNYKELKKNTEVFNERKAK